MHSLLSLHSCGWPLGELQRLGIFPSSPAHYKISRFSTNSKHFLSPHYEPGSKVHTGMWCGLWLTTPLSRSLCLSDSFLTSGDRRGAAVKDKQSLPEWQNCNQRWQMSIAAFSLGSSETPCCGPPADGLCVGAAFSICPLTTPHLSTALCSDLHARSADVTSFLSGKLSECILLQQAHFPPDVHLWPLENTPVTLLVQVPVELSWNSHSGNNPLTSDSRSVSFLRKFQSTHVKRSLWLSLWWNGTHRSLHSGGSGRVGRAGLYQALQTSTWNSLLVFPSIGWVWVMGDVDRNRFTVFWRSGLFSHFRIWRFWGFIILIATFGTLMKLW